MIKVHGSKNTFYLVEVADEHEFDWPHFARWICDINNGGGADGVLVVCPSEKADAKMRVINADGSEASMCGNGLRCVARYVCEKLSVDSAYIETMKVTLHVEKAEPLAGELPTYAVEIAPVSFNLADLPMAYNGQQTLQHEVIDLFSPTIRFTAVAVPNPHLIGIVNEHYISHTSHQFLLAQFLNSENPFCPDGVNVSYAFPVDPSTIYVRTYERGVGFTNACGTAMTASALVAKINGFVEGEEIKVYNPGGFVKCKVNQVDGKWKLSLIGNATYISTHKIEKIDNNYLLHDCDFLEERLQYKECMETLTFTK